MGVCLTTCVGVHGNGVSAGVGAEQTRAWGKARRQRTTEAGRTGTHRPEDNAAPETNLDNPVPKLHHINMKRLIEEPR